MMTLHKKLPIFVSLDHTIFPCVNDLVLDNFSNHTKWQDFYEKFARGYLCIAYRTAIPLFFKPNAHQNPPLKRVSQEPLNHCKRIDLQYHGFIL